MVATIAIAIAENSSSSSSITKALYYRTSSDGDGAPPPMVPPLCSPCISLHLYSPLHSHTPHLLHLPSHRPSPHAAPPLTPPPPLRRPSSHTAAATVLLNPPREGVVEPQVLAAALGLGLGLRPDRARWRSRAGDLPYISPIPLLYLAGPRGGAACGECHLPLM